MERNIQRINGIKMDLSRLTDDELEGSMAYCHDRAEGAYADLEKLGIESARRFALGETALADVIQIPTNYNQGVLFDPDGVA